LGGNFSITYTYNYKIIFISGTITEKNVGDNKKEIIITLDNYNDYFSITTTNEKYNSIRVSIIYTDEYTKALSWATFNNIEITCEIPQPTGNTNTKILELFGGCFSITYTQSYEIIAISGSVEF